tara:strand:- start:3374 stop:3862 length:489 start_codon:yes stop_codon:yes gene_type:complete
MKRITKSLTLPFMALIGLGLSFPCWSHGDEKHAEASPFFVNADSAPGKTVSAFHQALASNDADTARSLLADDVLIFEGGGIERSADEYASHHMLADMKYIAALKSTTLEHQVNIMGDMAVSVSRSKTTGSYKGKDVDYEGMETMLLQKNDGKWKISHIHWSR